MIRVIDAICGSGKSTAILNMIRENPDKRYLYITPYLSEIEERLPDQLPEVKFHTPQNNGEGKRKDFNTLVEEGYNVATTHKLFGMLSPSTINILISQQYCLIIDENLDCMGLLPQGFKESDTKALLAGDFVLVDDENRGKLNWNEDKYPEHDGKYAKVRGMCQLDMLYCYKGIFLMWEYPPKLLKGLEEIYMLTYLFKGSDMKSWLDMNKIKYSYVDCAELGLIPDEIIKEEVRENLEILENRNLTNTKQQKGTLSWSWFCKANTDSLNRYKAMLRSTVVQNKAKSGDVFWTTFKDHASKLSGSGYTSGIKTKAGDSSGKISFLPCNIRATNDYRSYWLCMYAMNRFKNPVEVNYMRENGVDVDEETYALSEMLQFIFRGCIRDGNPMKVIILSKRMKRLLEEWLYE